ncbi:nuclear transport factor 2 family protein [Phenylobacterium sp.]|uniref:nuclear transport factor 2 family protein n=1 Tax=Phenylobacterium sp. TaxID=1871053 RepID=UPI0025D55B24|nr:nuclear transport factor 2 family protein [Phenylobacterium sp.]
MIRFALLASTLALLAVPALAAPALTDASVRAFVAAQQDAWNAGALDRYFGAFTPEARFTDQAYVGDKPPVPYGTSTLAEARAQSRQARAKGPSREAGRIVSIRIAADGRTAQVVSRIEATVRADGRTRRLCAARGQALVLRGGRILSTGQTDTFYKCSP